MKRRDLFLVLVLLSLRSAQAESAPDPSPTIQLRVEVSPRDIYIGDVIRLEATVFFSSSLAASPVELPSLLGEFEPLDYRLSPPEPSKRGQVKLSHTLLLTTFSTGTQTIPSLTLKFAAPDGSQADAKTEPFDIHVKSLLNEKGDLGGLQPLKGLFNFKSYFWIWTALIVVIISFACFLIWRKWSKKKDLDISLATKNLKPPEEIAWEALYQLEQSDLLSKGQLKEFYYRLSLLLRHYLEGRFQISALDRTTTELILEFRRINLSSELFSLAREFFENADLVKFAKFTPSENDVEEDLSRVKELLTKTTPQKVEEKKPAEQIPL